MSGLQRPAQSGRGAVFITSRSSIALLMIVFLLDWGSVAWASPDSGVAVWWPAAGASALFMFRLHRTHWRWGSLGIVIVTAVAATLGGRDVVISLIFAVANAAEAWVVCLVLIQGARVRPVLNRLSTAFRLGMAVALGALLMGLIAGTTVLVFDGVALFRTWVDVSSAHAAAIILILPFALVPRGQLIRINRLELGIQILVLAATLFYVLGPGRPLPLTFLLMPVIAWAALRFPTRVVLMEIVGLALGISLFLMVAGGPFSQAAEFAANPSMLLHVFLIAAGFLALLAAASQNEYRTVTATLANRERVLRAGFLGSRVGLLIVERATGGYRVLESNPIAADLIAAECRQAMARDGESVTLWFGTLAARVDQVIEHGLDRFGWHAERDGTRSDIEVLIASLDSEEGSRYSLQFVDFSISRRSQDAQDVAVEHMLELARQKEDFVASASHELRTPITSIIGYVELLEEEELDDFQRSSVRTIARNARRLADLVESLLELGTPRGPGAEVLVSDGEHVAKGAVLSLERIAEKSGINLMVESSGPLVIAVPEIDLDRLLMNLVGNALKFTPRNGRVVVRLSSTGSSAILKVIDTGTGMTPGVIKHIFERFYRAPDAQAEGISGTGLGLPLVSGLVTKHHGTVAVESLPGSGSTFTVTLPLGDPGDLPRARRREEERER